MKYYSYPSFFFNIFLNVILHFKIFKSSLDRPKHKNVVSIISTTFDRKIQKQFLETNLPNTLAEFIGFNESENIKQNSDCLPDRP